MRKAQIVKLRIPMPWTGRYYAIIWDEILPGRLWLCFTWWTEGKAVFFGIGLVPYFALKTKANDHG